MGADWLIVTVMTIVTIGQAGEVAAEPLLPVIQVNMLWVWDKLRSLDEKNKKRDGHWTHVINAPGIVLRRLILTAET